jgi:arsenate reductase
LADTIKLLLIRTKVKKFDYNFSYLAMATGTDEELTAEFRIVRQLIKDYCRQFVIGNL